MLNKNVISMLGLCAKARMISSGSVLIEDIKKKKVCFVIIAENASDNTKKKISDKCRYYQIEYVITGDSDTLSHAIGKDNRMAAGILNQGFADSIKSKLGG